MNVLIMVILVYDLVVAQKLRDVEEEGGGPSDPGTGAAAAPTEGGRRGGN